jgi:hypothetical protein
LKRTLFAFTSSEPIVTFLGSSNGTYNFFSFFVVAGNYKAKQQYRRIKIDTFLINVLFFEGINYFYVLLFVSSG